VFLKNHPPRATQKKKNEGEKSPGQRSSRGKNIKKKPEQEPFKAVKKEKIEKEGVKKNGDASYLGGVGSLHGGQNPKISEKVH